MLISNLDRLLVVAHLGEDISWLNSLPLPYCLVTQALRDHPNFLTVNKGHEALCYLQYMIEYYHMLPREIGFFHAHEESGHQSHTTPHIVRHYRWGQFQYMNVNRDDWYNTLTATNHYATEYSWIGHFWSQVGYRFLGPLPEVFEHYASAQFVVSADRVRARPREFYQACYDWIVDTPLERCMNAQVFDATWHYILGAPNPEPRRSQSDFLTIVDPHQGERLKQLL